jgi:hypothetical protein
VWKYFAVEGISFRCFSLSIFVRASTDETVAVRHLDRSQRIRVHHYVGREDPIEVKEIGAPVRRWWIGAEG